MSGTRALLAAVSADTRRGDFALPARRCWAACVTFPASMSDSAHLSDVERDVVQGYARRMTAPAHPLARAARRCPVAMRQAPDP